MAKYDAKLEQTAVNTIRFLAVDAIQKANSGHPGLPMGMADGAFVLFDEFLRHDPKQTKWPGRDRFVLSAGHGSMLLYAMLHLTGYDLSMDDIKQFRQLDSKTPGHPEYGHTAGVETTTGPLGQGFGNGVGMALASRLLHARLEGDGFSPADYRVFGIVSDGDLMEGIASEAASLAGHWQLGRLNYLYDDNKISIEGSTDLTFSEDVAARFSAYGWHVQKVDGHDRAALRAALEAAAQTTDKPSIICAQTHIGFGSPNKQDSASCHGSPLGPDEINLTKDALDWPRQPDFLVPDEVGALFAQRAQELAQDHAQWEEKYQTWRKDHQAKAALWDQLNSSQQPEDLLPQLIQAAGDQPLATRALSGKVLQRAAQIFPGLIGGSADLAPSNKTWVADQPPVSAADFSARNIHFGIREHAMGSIMNGMALSDGIIPYGGTFLVFADYMRPSIRLACLMGLGCIYVFTHDSIFVGEDGPTHQPVEQLSSLRGIPGLNVIRPADPLETGAAWAMALARRDGPTALALTRQKLPLLERPAAFQAQQVMRGAYVLVEEKEGNKAVVVATGSEVAAAAQAARKLGIRCVSMPCVETFLEQSQDYRSQVLPPDFKVACVEAGLDAGWHRFIGPDGLIIGMEGFGASAPGADLGQRFGFNEQAIGQKLGDWYQS